MLTNVYMKTSSPPGLVRAYFVVQMSVCVSVCVSVYMSVYMSVQMSVYMSVQMCRCPYADSVSARECLSHASSYLECSYTAFTGGFHDRPSPKTTTKHEDFKNPVKSTVYG